MTAQPTSPPAAPVFPIQQFTRVAPEQITDALNDLIVDINAAIVGATGGAGATGLVTRRQLFYALRSQGIYHTIAQAVPIESNAYDDWNSAQTLAISDPLGVLIQTTMAYSAAQMLALWTLAGTFRP